MNFIVKMYSKPEKVVLSIEGLYLTIGQSYFDENAMVDLCVVRGLKCDASPQMNLVKSKSHGKWSFNQTLKIRLSIYKSPLGGFTRKSAKMMLRAHTKGPGNEDVIRVLGTSVVDLSEWVDEIGNTSASGKCITFFSSNRQIFAQLEAFITSTPARKNDTYYKSNYVAEKNFQYENPRLHMDGKATESVTSDLPPENHLAHRQNIAEMERPPFLNETIPDRLQSQSPLTCSGTKRDSILSLSYIPETLPIADQSSGSPQPQNLNDSLQAHHSSVPGNDKVGSPLTPMSSRSFDFADKLTIWRQNSDSSRSLSGMSDGCSVGSTNSGRNDPKNNFKKRVFDNRVIRLALWNAQQSVTSLTAQLTDRIHKHTDALNELGRLRQAYDTLKQNLEQREAQLEAVQQLLQETREELQRLKQADVLV